MTQQELWLQAIKDETSTRLLPILLDNALRFSIRLDPGLSRYPATDGLCLDIIDIKDDMALINTLAILSIML